MVQSNTEIEEVPVIDMKCFLERTGDWEKECKKVAQSLHRFGILIVRDPRVDHSHNSEYIDMMEKYFE